jgi:prolyl oligopeptidase
VSEQNRLSREYLDGLSSQAWFRETLQRIVARPRAGTPDKVGGRYLVSRNDGTQQQDQWFVADTLEDLLAGGRLLIDPNTFPGRLQRQQGRPSAGVPGQRRR